MSPLPPKEESPMNALKSTSPSCPGADVSSLMKELKSTSPSGVESAEGESDMNASRSISPSSKSAAALSG